MENRLKVKDRGRGQHQLVLEMAACEVSDADMTAICTAIETGFDAQLAAAAETGAGASQTGRAGWSLFLLLEENHITATGLRELVQWMIAFREKLEGRLVVHGLRLHMNELDDEAALVLAELVARLPEPLKELHLSHNRITEVGATALLLAIANKQDAAYPSIIYVQRTADKQKLACKVKPLWLRLEQNRIDVDAVKAELRSRNVLYVSSMKHREVVVTVKSGHPKREAQADTTEHQQERHQQQQQSMITQALDSQLPKFNIPFFNRLSQQLKVSTLFSAAAKPPRKQKHAAATATATATATAAPARGPRTASAAETAGDEVAEAQGTEAPGQEEVAEAEKVVCVLDTNAVVSMCSQQHQGLSFDAMLRMLEVGDSQRGTPRSKTTPRILFVLLDTVRKELVGIKAASGFKIRQAVNHFFGRVLEEAVEKGILVIADPVELEDVVQRRGGHAWRPAAADGGTPARPAYWASQRQSDFVRSIVSSQRDNDGMILDCTNILRSLCPAYTQVVLLSNDVELTVRAKQFGVRVVPTRSLANDVLFDLKLFSALSERAPTPHRPSEQGTPTPPPTAQSATPASSFAASPLPQHTSVYAAMEEAVKLTERSIEIIQELLSARRVPEERELELAEQQPTVALQAEVTRTASRFCRVR